MRLIGIAGNTRSGKDTVADYLVDKYGYQKVSLADPIKRFCMSVFRFSEDQLWDQTRKNYHDKRYCTYSPGSGSDEAWSIASHLMRMHGKRWVDEVLADKSDKEREFLYARLLHWFHWLGENHPKLTPRVVLQTLGTEWGRTICGADVWVNYLFKITDKLLASEGSYSRTQGYYSKHGNDIRGIVIPDVRFGNEIVAFKDRGVLLARIHRPDVDSKAQSTGIEHHASESEQLAFVDKEFDFVLNNIGTLASLYENVDIFMSTLGDQK